MIIIDNSETNNEVLSAEISNIIYTANCENEGVTAALNIGCQKAEGLGFAWTMTMDQDSCWNDTQSLQRFLALAAQISSADEKSVS